MAPFIVQRTCCRIARSSHHPRLVTPSPPPQPPSQRPAPTRNLKQQRLSRLPVHRLDENTYLAVVPSPQIRHTIPSAPPLSQHPQCLLPTDQTNQAHVSQLYAPIFRENLPSKCSAKMMFACQSTRYMRSFLKKILSCKTGRGEWRVSASLRIVENDIGPRLDRLRARMIEERGREG
ncbi:hypothetical protein AB1N83_002215 [Pleurotus pulmonarius]